MLRDRTRMRAYDVVIVGAGPAGAFFARELALNKPEIKIALINGQKMENAKPCGGLLSPDAQKLLAKFNLTLPNSVLADPQIFAVETIDLGTGCVRYYQRHYLNMNRYKLDMHLLSLVPSSVDIIADRCLSIERENEIYKLRLKNGEVCGLSIVGADGASSIVARSLFNKKTYKYTSIQGIYKCENPHLPHYSCIFDKKTSDSCSWTIQKNDYFIFGGAFKTASCREAYEKQKERLEEFIGYNLGKPLKIEACMLTSPRKFSDFFIGDKGAYLIGEAGGFISASSFEGISSAILSGKLLADAYINGKNHKEILKLYKKKTRKLRLKLFLKIQKRRILCSPFLRFLIMKSGIKSVEKYEIYSS